MGVCLKLINIRIFPLHQLSCMGRQSVNSMILLKKCSPNSTYLYDLHQFKSVPSTSVYLLGKMEFS